MNDFVEVTVRVPRSIARPMAEAARLAFGNVEPPQPLESPEAIRGYVAGVTLSALRIIDRDVADEFYALNM
ncbi:MAG TPA: hypothetical protein VFA59_16890 [Vicinamibacterales bacterium]|nr:hypothetical protein [Vicinamibacterales bacterium]